MQAQASSIPPGQLDPARNPAALHPFTARPLTEQFIWTAGDAAALNPALQASVRGQQDKTAPHFFRVHFHLASVPPDATLYLAGPRSATVMLNGQPVLDFTDDGRSAKGFAVRMAELHDTLHPGDNVLAVREIRGHSSLHTGASPTINQVTYGEVLLLKIVPAALAIDAPPILVTDAHWRSRLDAGPDWASPTLDDSAWPLAQPLGIAGSNPDFLQWNADAGLYAWPGYSGIGSGMGVLTLPPVALLDLNDLSLPPSRPEFRISHTPSSVGELTLRSGAVGEPTAVTLDFGRELSGRVHLISHASNTQFVETSYGESSDEALAHPYLGPHTLIVPAHGEAYGPKSAFRFVRLTFGPESSAWTIDAQAISRPVTYAGSFTCSDPLLNRIWETAAYTAHLTMGDGIWDAPKRDRGRWMGDLDVTGRTINAVFAERPLMESTMANVIGPAPVTRDVNTIAGYSALWITGQADFCRHLGDLAYLRLMQPRLLSLLHVMDAELDPGDLFTNPAHHKVFVDWSEGFSADTPDARAATQFEFYLAYREAAWLLTELGDQPNATLYRTRAEALNHAAQTRLLTPDQTFGARWQTNAMAVVSGAATDTERASIWTSVLAHVNDPAANAVITPYYGFYVLSAMADLDHRPDALAWMRRYWGGMIAEGATSFYEAYDPHWPKENFHAYLQADGKTGDYVSLAHGWSSGPAAWLMSEILGIEPTAAGFHEVRIRPDLAGLAFARGSEPTPRGLIRVDITSGQTTITLPPATIARVLLPAAAVFTDNGRPIPHTAAEAGKRSELILRTPGSHILRAKGNSP